MLNKFLPQKKQGLWIHFYHIDIFNPIKIGVKYFKYAFFLYYER